MVGIVTVVPCRSVGVMASVTSEVRPSCVGNLAPRRRLWQGVVCARAQEGSGEAKLASEAKGFGETESCARGQGVERDGTCARALGCFKRWRYPFLRFLFPSFGYPIVWYPTLAPEPMEG
jgi:hypothetical protein